MKKALVLLLLMIANLPSMAQWPGLVPDPKDQLFVLVKRLKVVQDSLKVSQDSVATLNTRVDTLLAADGRVRRALKDEALNAAQTANTRMGNMATDLAFAENRAIAADRRVVTIGDTLAVRTKEVTRMRSKYEPITWFDKAKSTGKKTINTVGVVALLVDIAAIVIRSIK